MPVTKIATCCYCGNRAVLELRGKIRHELACSSCGAPLHDLKRIPRKDDTSARKSVPAHRSAPAHPARSMPHDPPDRPRKAKRKSRKGFRLWGKIAEEIWDGIEDIFD
ncbi:hypothetical protein [Marivivens marinus]|uniref:hypothetical protein n=1 Tax=Marivivens marinus TaxID=3110173 RepID=UPI003B84A4A9